MVSLIQRFEADFLRKVSLKILNSGIILKLSPMGSRPLLFGSLHRDEMTHKNISHRKLLLI